MKRTPLQRSSPLSRGKGKRRVSMGRFWAVVTDLGMAPCAICLRGEPLYRVDAHHFVAKRHLPDSAKTDERNGVALCRECHEHVENRRLECPRPPDLDAFLEDWGLLESGRPDPKRRAA